MRFELKVIRGGGAVSVLGMDAAGPEAARAEAERGGYTVLSLRAAGGLGAGRLRRPARFPLLLFAQELHALLEAGLSLLEALESLAEKDRGGAAGAALAGVMRALREGRSLSQALAARPEAFPPFFVATVRASERTGHLPEALARFAAYQTQLDSVRKKVVSASIYPALLVGVGSLVLVFLLAYVVPRFSRIFEDSAAALPWSTQLLVAWGTALEAHGAAIGLGALGALAGAAALASRAPVRLRLLAFLWRVGPLGERVRVFQLARFYRTLGMLVQGGMPMVPALDLAEHVLPRALRRRLAAARRAISEGVATSQAMEANGLATPVALRMLRVGERGGNMGEMLERIAAFLDEETARWIDWFTRLFEPALMALIGLLIGAIVVLMYLPIFGLAGAVQ
jgi:general secretion pathway protein F